MDKKGKTKPDESEVLLSFLKKTKDGKYAPVDPSSFQYIRIKEQTEITEEEYYYGIS